MYGEAVVVFNQSLLTMDEAKVVTLKYRHKQMMQLASKQRFIAVQFFTMLQDDLWKKSSEYSNAMAQKFKQRLESFSKEHDKLSMRITRPVDTNAIFLQIPKEWYEPLSETFPFYMWRPKISEVRLMCSFDTTDDDIDQFMNKMKELSQK